MISIKLSEDDINTKLVKEKRLASIAEAISWNGGPDVDHKKPTAVFSAGDYEVRLAKPGKEAAPGYMGCKYKNGDRGNNPNDMRPELVFKSNLIEKNATFKDIFYELENIYNYSPEGLRLLADLMARSAFMADHKQESTGVWRYHPPQEAIELLSSIIPIVYDVPIEVFLYYIDALALNEDVKYHTLGYPIGQGYGRRNNLLTCVHLVAVLLKEVRISDFAGSMARPPAGVAPISTVGLLEVFPELAT